MVGLGARLLGMPCFVNALVVTEDTESFLGPPDATLPFSDAIPLPGWHPVLIVLPSRPSGCRLSLLWPLSRISLSPPHAGPAAGCCVPAPVC